ncbi:MAG: hypothetical protein AAF693_06790 [Bacteroidota bacterium]
MYDIDMLKFNTLLIPGIMMLALNLKCSAPEIDSGSELPVINATNSQFNQYWYAGKAEITSYRLKQARYGEVHDGEAVLVFVTEPFSKSDQVKLDYADQAGNDKMTVLKLNYTKKFNTGIYPYSMMLSVFTPVDTYNYQYTPKVTASIQEWCGQVYTQMNLEKSKYQINAYSYFQQEGDKSFSSPKGFLEDEIFNRIRVDYKSLPQGEFELIPGLFFTRLEHENLKIQPASARLQEGDGIITYSVQFKKADRKLEVTFNKVFPHNILGWTESYKAGGQVLTTTAKAKKSVFIDYWTRNNVSDTYLRDSLDLQF